MATTYLHWTPSSAGNRRTWTFSAWVKVPNASGRLLSGGTHVSNGAMHNLDFITNRHLRVEDTGSDGQGNNYISVKTNRVFRDPAAWYHIVVAIDTTQYTASNRVKIYVNGEQETSFSTATYPSQNYETSINMTNQQIIGARAVSSSGTYFSGLMSHVNFIDGTAYTPSAFGMTNSTTGDWSIITAPNVTYGSNGYFILKDGNSVTDQSPNTNNFTVGGGNLTLTKDNPSNNFAVWDSNTQSDGTYSNGNLSKNGGDDMCATMGVTSGKWYWETKKTNTGGSFHAGITCTDSSSNHATQFLSGTNTVNSSAIWIREDGLVTGRDKAGYTSSHSHTDNFSSLSNGDIMAFALDLDSSTKRLTYYKNGSEVGNTTFTYGGYAPIFPFFRMNTGCTGTCNFGNGYFETDAITTNSGNGYAGAEGASKFYYQPPTGHKALTTKGINS